MEDSLILDIEKYNLYNEIVQRSVNSLKMDIKNYYRNKPTQKRFVAYDNNVYHGIYNDNNIYHDVYNDNNIYHDVCSPDNYSSDCSSYSDSSDCSSYSDSLDCSSYSNSSDCSSYSDCSDSSSYSDCSDSSVKYKYPIDLHNSRLNPITTKINNYRINNINDEMFYIAVLSCGKDFISKIKKFKEVKSLSDATGVINNIYSENPYLIQTDKTIITSYYKTLYSVSNKVNKDKIIKPLNRFISRYKNSLSYHSEYKKETFIERGDLNKLNILISNHLNAINNDIMELLKLDYMDDVLQAFLLIVSLDFSLSNFKFNTIILNK